MFDHILVPLDGSPLSESVLPHVVAIANTCNAQITLMHVVEQGSPIAPVDPASWSLLKVEAKAYLQEICTRFLELGWQCAMVVEEGHAADRIIRYAQDNLVNLIVMGSHGRGGLSGWNISSVVQKVILRSCTSVMVVPAYRIHQLGLADLWYERVFLPLDGSQRAENALPLAVKLASDHKAALVLAHIVPRPEMPSHLPLSQAEVELSDQVVERNQREAEKYLADIQSRLASIDLELKTCLEVRVNPVEALHELVERENADLLVLNAHGSSASCRYPFGSVTLSFIAYGDLPLLILQDLSPGGIRPTMAEVAAQEHPAYQPSKGKFSPATHW